MDSLMKADIFFFVSTIFLVIFSILGLVGVIYVIKILHDVKNIAAKIKNESENIIADVSQLRSGIKAKAARAANVQSAASIFKTVKNVWDGMKSSTEGGRQYEEAEIYENEYDEDDIDAEIEELLARKKHRRRRRKK